MKKISYIMVSLSFAAIMMFSSCKKPNNIVTPTSGGTVTNSFTASIGDGSKTYLDGVDVYWSQGDYIYVNGTGDQNNYVFQPEIPEPGGEQPPVYEPATRGTFVNQSHYSEFVAKHYFAAYQKSNNRINSQQGPSIDFPYFEGEGENMKAYFFIPQNQTESCRATPNPLTGEGTIGLNGSIPMAAYSDTKSLVFYNLVNVVQLDLSAVASSKDGEPVIVNNVTISSSENLWGKFSVGTNLQPSATELVATQGQGGPGQPVLDPTPEIYANELNLNITSTQSSYLYFIIPAASVGNNTLHIRVDGTNGAFIKDVQLKDNDTPNHLHKIKLDVKLEPVPYLFSVATNKLVVFSPSNLCIHPGGYTFEQDDAQPGFRKLDQTYYSISRDPDRIDHFVWTSHEAKASYGYGYDYNYYPGQPDPDYTFGENEILFTNYTDETPNPNFTVAGENGPEKGVWRSLSTNEMKFMLGTDQLYNPEDPNHQYYGRDNAWKKCGKVKIKVVPEYGSQRDVYGFLILPDNYTYQGHPSGFDETSLNLGGPFGKEYQDFTGGIETYQGSGDYQNVWAYLKEHGAVFLPSSGSTLASANNGDPSVTYTFDGCGESGALYLSDGFITKDYQSQDYPPYNYKHYCNCFYWNGTTQTSSANWCTQSETKFGRLIRLVKDF